MRGVGHGAHMTTTAARPLALVTGASSGIGRALAEELADRGHDLIVVAEDERIRQGAEELRARGVDVQSIEADLATPEGVEQVWREIAASGRPLELVALNAGVAVGGAFAGGTALEDELRLVDLNVRSVVHLAKRVIAQMTARGHGRMLITSSIAATAPGPFQAVYNASKSFVQSFALGLREEARGTGVTVTALMPGPTDTEIFARGGLLDTRLGASSHKDDPAEVAHQGLEATFAGRDRVVAASLRVRAQAILSRALPDAVKARLMRRETEPGSASPRSGDNTRRGCHI